MLDKQTVQENLRKVREEILAACEKAGVDSSTVALLAVSKTHSSEMVRWCFESGQIDFGENYVQEALSKKKEIDELPLRWHFIGTLQKNKVKNVVGAFSLIHSVDSVELAAKISQKAGEIGVSQKILLEVNLGDETSKGGFSCQMLREQFSQLMELPHLELAGLMALPPLFEDSENTRPYFRELKRLFIELCQRLPLPRQPLWRNLSMGTTHDFAVAIEEGATIVRVGTALFGQRRKRPLP
jgi:pyridoxal phosphate enzyme (YggS family)